jgi:hypothetical protein
MFIINYDYVIILVLTNARCIWKPLKEVTEL